MRPYRTTDDKIDGVVITFVDVTERKFMEERLRSLVNKAGDPNKGPLVRRHSPDERRSIGELLQLAGELDARQVEQRIASKNSSAPSSWTERERVVRGAKA